MWQLLLSGWLTLAWLPQGTLLLYDNPTPQILDAGGSFYIELGMEASWGLLYVGGIAKIPMWKSEGINFYPFQLESTFDTGLAWGPARLGWRHTCAHPVIPYLSQYQWQGHQITPRWDSAYDAVYLTVRW